MKIYLKGQEQTDAYDKYDYEMCGENQPEIMISDGPRLVMIFASGDSQGRGFKAKYSFETGMSCVTVVNIFLLCIPYFWVFEGILLC